MEDSRLVVDTFLISCRALGRGVEHRMLAFLGDQAAERGLATIGLELRETAKNLPAQQFVQSVGGAGNLPVQAARSVRWKPATPSEKPRAPRPARTGAAGVKVDFARIARTARNSSTRSLTSPSA